MICLKMFTKHIFTKKETFSRFKNQKPKQRFFKNRSITMATLSLHEIDALCDFIKQTREEKDPNRNKTYTMTESEVKNLVEERLSKLDELEDDFNE